MEIFTPTETIVGGGKSNKWAKLLNVLNVLRNRNCNEKDNFLVFFSFFRNFLLFKSLPPPAPLPPP